MKGTRDLFSFSRTSKKSPRSAGKDDSTRLSIRELLQGSDAGALERAVEYHDYQYWVLDAAVISDEDYDLLHRRLEELKPDSPVLQRVGGGGLALESFRQKVEHSSPMLSLDKCYDEERFDSWLKTTVGRAIKNAVAQGTLPEVAARYADFGEVATEDELPMLAGALKVAVSPKVDGVAASIRYDGQGQLLVAATRGDGTSGEDFTINARLISGIPWEVATSEIEVRGEVYMRRSVFKAKYSDSFPNPRNLTAGTLKQKESARSQLLDLDFFAYDLLGAKSATEEEKRQRLLDLGFTPVESQFMEAKVGPVRYAEALLERDEWDFDADGLVVRLNDVALQSALGVTAHHPRFAIAFKFQGDTGITTLEEVEWSVARSGTITPVAILAPVFLSGARVSRSTLHNISEFNKLKLSLGDRLQLKRRGDVIPKVEGNLGGGSRKVSIPPVCPSCGSNTLFAAPQLFVSGFRLARFADRQQLRALVKHQIGLSRKVGILSPAETHNSVARRTGDLRYKSALTWPRGDSEQRKNVAGILSGLPGVRRKNPELVILAILDPDLDASHKALSMAVELLEEYPVEIRIVPVGDSRLTGKNGGREVRGAGGQDEFPAWLTRTLSAIGSPTDSDLILDDGDFSKANENLWNELAVSLSEDSLVCSRPDSCPAVTLGRLEHFVQTLGVDGFGSKIIVNLHESGLLRSREDFFKLKLEDLVDLERMGETLAEKLLANLQGARAPSLSLFLQSLGIDEVARHVSGILEKEYATVERVLEVTEEELMGHESIAFGIAHQVVHGLRRHRQTIERLQSFVNVEAPLSSDGAGEGAFSGASFVFTGKMRTMPRKIAQEAVQELGGETPDRVRTDLTWLVVGDEGSPLFGGGTRGGKLKKADKHIEKGAAIRIISETDFLEMLERARSDR